MSVEKTVIGADNYYAYPSFEYSSPVYTLGHLTSSKIVVRGNNRGYCYAAFPESEILITTSLSATPSYSFINEFNFISSLFLNDYFVLNLLSAAIDRTVISDIREVVVGADNYYYAFPSWISAAIPLTVECLITCCDNLKSESDIVLSHIFKIGDAYFLIRDERLLIELILRDFYSQDAKIFFDSSLFSFLDFDSFLYHTYEESISDVIKPTVRTENYYAYPSWLPPEHLYVNFTLNCGESYELINEGVISKAFKLDDTYSRLYESFLSLSLLTNEIYSTESQLLNIESLLSSLYIHPFLFHKYEKGIIDTIKPTVKSENYYAYPSWVGPEAISLLVSIPLSFTSHYQSIKRIFDTLLLALKTHYVFPTNVLNVYLALGLNPRIGNYTNLIFYLPFTIQSDLQTIFDSYIKYNLNFNIFSSSIRDLNVPINLFLKHISSAFSTISFSQILSSSSKTTLESMLETLVSASLKDTYSSERITKGILTVSTDAAFVPLFQMVYEYSLTAPLIFSPILTTVKKSKALIKYLTIDIKKFNITINIETIERE